MYVWKFTSINGKNYFYKTLTEYNSVDELLIDLNSLRCGHILVTEEIDNHNYRIHHSQFIDFKLLYKR